MYPNGKTYKAMIESRREEIIKWFAKGADNQEVAERLEISVSTLARHTMHWNIKKTRRRPIYKQALHPEPCSDGIRHLALHAKWTAAN